MDSRDDERARLVDLRTSAQDLERSLAGHVFVVVIEGSPGELKINNAKKPARIRGKDGNHKLTMVDEPAVKRAKKRAASRVQAEAFGNPEAAHAISSAPTLIVEVDSYWPKRRHLSGTTDLAIGDVDAPLKLTIDALEKSGLIDDDARVVEVRARKFLGSDRPRIEMRVFPEVQLNSQLGLPVVK